MGSKRKKQTVGYKYFVGMEMAICQSFVDSLREIWVGEKKVWDSSITSTGTITIDEPTIFGGDEKEGGIEGDVDIEFGESTQSFNSYLSNFVGDIGAGRGLFRAVLNQVYVGNNAYIKPWNWVVRRQTKSWDNSTIWNDSKAAIGQDMNPIHIIYDMLTSKTYGLGLIASDIDLTSFVDAADTLYNESFGISIGFYNDGKTIKEFIDEILDIIDGVIYQDIQTNKMVVKLARDDYNPATIPSFGEDDIIELSGFSRTLLSNTVNHVIVNYTNTGEWVTETAIVTDIAVKNRQKSIVSKKYDFLPITSKETATKVAQRELKQLSSGLFKARIIGTREMFDLRQNDVFKMTFNIEPFFIEEAIVRVVNISYGSLSDNTITLDVVEDVFAEGKTVFDETPDTEWTNPASDPADITTLKLNELLYWTAAVDLFDNSTMSAKDDLSTVYMISAIKPSGDTFVYDILSKESLETNYISDGRNDLFTPSCLLDGAISISDTVIDYDNESNILSVEENTYAFIGDEIVEIVSVNTTLKQLTVNRGILDTVPAAHVDNTRVWFTDGLYGLNDREYFSGDTVNFKFLTSTSQGTLLESAASVNSDTVDNPPRYLRPYPPGNVSSSFVSNEFTLNWTHRDRTQQTAYFVLQSEGNIGPELGTTYTIRLYDSGDVLLRTVTGQTGTSYTYAIQDERDDTGLDVSGATNPAAVNGNFSRNGSFNGKARYDQGVYSLWWNSGSVQWVITLTSTIGTLPSDYFSLTNSDPAGTYTANGAWTGTVVVADETEIKFQLESVRDTYSSFQYQSGSANR